ncbi:MAG: 16S rRNA (guanine(527)-N(7))-methyltransferase RsmG [Candidatus Cloacimonetes bacterium HGW-Cloacimonetes-3]|jgi:16S rRNA (guanine527-N7)-methyltransferase|nr:MAG: 16S rRNA (guanine(527)-N(7))-methyltransferase RsmG [Candidatus Cloacimonetes bacterium HGW-Cloacimonetes-3]
MTEPKKRFEAYLKERDFADIPQLMGRFEHYFQLLSTTNRVVNLVSRNIPLERYWVQHFLDSLLALECLDLTDKTVLDFGSGGGIPGIPLKLIVPQCTLVMLDSVQKKTHAMQEFVEALSLPDTSVVCSRLEDYAFTAGRPSYDYIVCRAVALEERYLAPLRRLLKSSGMVIFYKSQKLKDLENLKHEILLETTDPDLGLRRIVGIKQRDLMMH